MDHWRVLAPEQPLPVTVSLVLIGIAGEIAFVQGTQPNPSTARNNAPLMALLGRHTAVDLTERLILLSHVQTTGLPTLPIPAMVR